MVSVISFAAHYIHCLIVDHFCSTSEFLVNLYPANVENRVSS
jgi:hypothetical protein